MNEAEYQGSSVRVFRFGSFRAFQHDCFERKCPLFEPIFCGAMAIKTFVRCAVVAMAVAAGELEGKCLNERWSMIESY